ncbi:AAA family ATPase [Cellulomonas xiejunii]|uniref:Uridine kinase n=1 Tax=Cellulomonas xiejunii TaxID=2968083 RepID=A0ABY5KMX3_9CELL|nr:AAA family ATPase [Cellulomonas xiejunii]MCC2320983.1 uridine kinase [Cellulomonas xiejunii]UUI71263.1 uridine kinase [Cellulomonas xiejunii]
MDARGDLELVVDRLTAAVPRGRRALVAVDGVGASGKTTFTARLAAAVRGRPVVVLHADDFFHPSAVRHARGRWSPEGFWQDAYDYGSLVALALAPLHPDGDGWYSPASFDRVADRVAPAATVRAPDDALVLVEGTFLHRDELREHWDWSVYLHVPFEVAARRMVARDGVDPDPEHGPLARYAGAQRRYFAAAAPWRRASLVVDTTGVPRVVAPSEVSTSLGDALSVPERETGRERDRAEAPTDVR